MVHDDFEKTMRADTGCAVVMAGSDSDREHIRKITDSLNRYKIPHRVRICSAHKQPEELMEMIREYNEIGGLVAYVAVAGGTDALSGILSYHTLGPVISCPPDTPNESCLRNPQGSSNSYIQKPGNVGRFIAQMYAGVNGVFRFILEDEKAKKISSLEQADTEFLRESRGSQ